MIGSGAGAFHIGNFVIFVIILSFFSFCSFFLHFFFSNARFIRKQMRNTRRNGASNGCDKCTVHFQHTCVVGSRSLVSTERVLEILESLLTHSVVASGQGHHHTVS